MTFIEKTGKSVDEAVAKALKELNVTEEQVNVEVLEEGKKGFLFGFGSKDAKVRVTLKEEAVEKQAEKTLEDMCNDSWNFLEKKEHFVVIWKQIV